MRGLQRATHDELVRFVFSPARVVEPSQGSRWSLVGSQGFLKVSFWRGAACILHDRRAMTLGTSSNVEELGRLVERVRGEFNEMPGMQLTEAQAARLWGVEPNACRHVVELLVGVDFLRRTPTGRIVRSGR